MTISARYENGVFRPLQIVEIADGTVVDVVVPPRAVPAEVRRSVKELPFFAMWKDRTDITGGLEYVDSLRENPRE